MRAVAIWCIGAHVLGWLLISYFFPVSLSGMCVGDCNNDGAVTVEELVEGVNIALDLVSPGDVPGDSCQAFDANSDEQVTVDELVRGIHHAIEGCPRDAGTPTGVPSSPIPNATESATHTLTPAPVPNTPTSTATQLSAISALCAVLGVQGDCKLDQ